MDAIRSRKPKKAEVSDISYEPFEGSVHSTMRTLILNMTAQLAKFDQILDRQELGYQRAQDLEKHGKGGNETQAIWR